jgi:hypothetical protein
MAKATLIDAQANAIVSAMSVRRRRLKEAESREGMRSMNVWLPDAMHRALTQARVEDGISANEVIRAAVRTWIVSRKRRKSKSRGER